MRPPRNDAEKLLVEVWDGLWTWDDCEEVCMANEDRNKIGKFLFELGLIDEYEPLPVPTED